MKRKPFNSCRPPSAHGLVQIFSLAFSMTCSVASTCSAQEPQVSQVLKDAGFVLISKDEKTIAKVEPGISISPNLVFNIGIYSDSTSVKQPPAPVPNVLPKEQTPTNKTPDQIPVATDSASPPKTDPSSGAKRPDSVPLDTNFFDVAGDHTEFLPGGNIRSENVKVTFSNVVVSADLLTGNTKHELIFSGNAKLDTKGATSYADAIHVFPDRNAFRLDNPRGILTPELLRNRVVDPIYIWSNAIAGTTDGYFLVDNCLATACNEHFHHYEFRIRQAELYPNEKLILRHVGVYFFGQRILTLPTLTIPLGLSLKRPRNPRTDYLPEIGNNSIEGYYARFPYSFTEGKDAATYLRADFTQKRGEGIRIEQEYLAGKQQSLFNTGSGATQGGGFTGATSGTIANAFGYGNTGRLPALGSGIGPQSGGLFTLQGYLSDGFSRDFNTGFRHQQGIGGGNRFAFNTELRKNSALLGNAQTSTNTRFNFNHSDSQHGSAGDITISYGTNDSEYTSGKFVSSQFSAGYHQSFEFGDQGSNRNSLSYSFDLSRFLTESGSGGLVTTNRTAHLDSQFQFDHNSREYSLSLQANKETAIGVQTSGGAFGTLERLPELRFTADTYNFKSGYLRRLPLRIEIGAGRFSEPSHSFQDDRLTLGFQVDDFSVLRGRTEVTTSGGFEQRLYGDGAAQYLVRNATRLRQHLGGRSGIDFRYDYSQPEGGTPFQFDTLGRSHSLTAEAGYLDDKHFQATARVGYDLLGTSKDRPFQTLTSRLMWRPTPVFRLDLLSAYDPNSGKFFSFTNRLGIRTRSSFSLDIVSRIDPQQPGIRRKFSQINTQFETPLGRTWNMTGLVRYNGSTGKFESQNLQVSHQWDCLEASFTYSSNPLSFRNNQQLFFSLRIKALPFSRGFARGSSGESLGVGLGDFN